MNRRSLDKAGPPFTQWPRGIIFEQKRHGKWEDADPRVKDPVLRRQEELQAAISGGAHGLSVYLHSKLQLTGVEIGAPMFPRSELTVREYRYPPVELEEEIGEAWRGVVQPSLALRPLFWLLCHIEWLEQRCFGTSGHRLAEMFTAGHRDKKLEGRTRNFLRRTGGLRDIRGNTSVFSDCPLARAWWRFHLAEQVERITTSIGARINRRTAHRTLHTNRPAWEESVMLSLQRITVINQPRGRAAIVRELDRRLESKGRIRKTDVQEIALVFARQGLRRSFEHTPWKDLA